MKILVVNKFFWNKGGSERVMFDLIRGYEAAGHEVVHFSMRSADNAPSPQAEHFVPEVRYDEGGGLAAAARAVYSGDAKRRIREVIRATRPHVAHLHNFHHQLSPSIVDALREEGVGCVHTLHDYKVICPNYLLYTEGRPCERCRSGLYHHAVIHRCLHGALGPSVVAFVEMTFHRVRGTLERGVRFFVSPSRFLAEKLHEFGISPERVRVVPNGLDLTLFRSEAAGGDEFLYVGRLSPEKGLLGLVEAVGRAPAVRLTIAGTGPQEDALRRRIEETAPDRIRMTGFLEREDLLQRIASCRAVVMPSEWYENAPISALEALASGVPVVGAAIGGIPEIVRDGETGLLFAPGDVGELARRLETLHGDEALARRLGARGREIAEREYSLGAQVESMLGILEEVATSGSR